MTSGAFLRRQLPSETLLDILFVLFVLAVALSPLYYGGSRPVAIAANAVVFSGLVIIFEGSRLLLRMPHPVRWSRFGWSAGLFAGVVVWALLQTVSWTPPSWHSPFWDIASQQLRGILPPGAVSGTISAAPDAGLLALIRILPNAMAFYLGLQLCRDRRRAELFALSLAVVIALYSTYGIIQLTVFPDHLLWGPKRSYLNAVTGPFVNRNSFATYASIGLIVTIGLMLDAFRSRSHGRPVPVAYRMAALVDNLARRALPLMVPALLIGVALIWSLSRGGIMSGLLGILALFVLFAASERGRGAVLAVSGLVMVALIGTMLTYGGGLAERLEEAGQQNVEDFSTRLTTPGLTFSAASDEPLLGFGYGSFPEVFPQYRDDPYIFGVWQRAHNTYAELAFELGFPAALILGVVVAGVLVQLFRNMAGRERQPPLSIFALAATVAVSVHALVDFSLQIPGVALTYWALIGAGLAQSWSRRIDTAHG